jgi:hypothetical protein
MKSHNLIRFIVTAYIAYVSAWSFVAGRVWAADAPYRGGWISQALLCAACACLIYTNPRKWSLPFGGLMLCLFAFRALLWFLSRDRISQMDPTYRTNLVPYGINDALEGLVAVLCFSLRWVYPATPNQSSDPTPASGTSPAGQEPRLP